MAPEINAKIPNRDNVSFYDQKSIDIWSLCVTFMVLSTMEQPKYNNEFIDAAEGYNGKTFREMPGYSQDFRDMLL